MKKVQVKRVSDGKIIFENDVGELSGRELNIFTLAMNQFPVSIRKLFGVEVAMIDEQDVAAPEQEQQSEAAQTQSIEPASGPILYLPANCGWFNDLSVVSASIAAALAIARDAGVFGRVGLSFEVTGSTGNADVQTRDFRAAYTAHCEKIVEVIETCAINGVPAKIDGINSNDFGKGWSASWKDTKENRAFIIEQTHKLVASLLPYKDWLIVQPVSENDNSMQPDFRASVRKVWVDAGWPKERLAAPDKAGGAGLDESHISGVVKSAKTGKDDLVTTDNGKGILANFEDGDVWSANKPKVDECIASARAHLSRGTSVALYHRAPNLHIIDHGVEYKEIVGSVADLLKVK